MALNYVTTPAIAKRPFLISFSGIDGAGKTTQIEHLCSCLQEHGLRVVRLSFWDDIAVWSKIRAGVGQQALGDRKADWADPGSFVPKNNKHIRKWYLSAVRAAFYLLDVARLRGLLASRLIEDSDVVILDRYIYDQIANIYSQSLAARVYARILTKMAPTPDLAFIVDASPAAAFARKPEYPLEFVHQNRRTFLRLREYVPQLIVISEGGPEEVRSAIYFHIRQSRLAERATAEGKPEVTAARAVVAPQTSCSVQNNPTATI
jgi:thymidylate kinase